MPLDPQRRAEIRARCDDPDLMEAPWGVEEFTPEPFAPPVTPFPGFTLNGGGEPEGPGWLADFGLAGRQEAEFAAHARQDVPDLLDALEAAEEALEKQRAFERTLHQRLAEILACPFLEGWERPDGTVVATLKNAGEFAQFQGELMADVLIESGALNSLEWRCHDPRIGDVALTLQRVSGKTPADQREEARAECARLREMLAVFGEWAKRVLASREGETDQPLRDDQCVFMSQGVALTVGMLRSLVAELEEANS